MHTPLQEKLDKLQTSAGTLQQLSTTVNALSNGRQSFDQLYIIGQRTYAMHQPSDYNLGEQKVEKLPACQPGRPPEATAAAATRVSAVCSQQHRKRLLPRLPRELSDLARPKLAHAAGRCANQTRDQGLATD